MVERVEVAVVGMRRIAGGRPNLLAERDVAAEAQHIAADRVRHRNILQRAAVHQESPHPGRRVLPLHSGPVRAFRRPDSVRPHAPSQFCVVQSDLQREIPHFRFEHWLEGMRGGTTEQFDRPGLDQRPQHRRSAVPPPRPELGQPLTRGAVLGRGQFPQHRVAAPARRRFVAAQPPIPQPVVEGPQAARIVQPRGQRRCDPQREHVPAAFGGEALQHPRQRQVAVRPRLVQPFLSDRPAAMPGEPRQMAVQHQAERADRFGHAATLRPPQQRRRERPASAFTPPARP